MSILDVGAGASEGLDKVLERMMLQQQIDERVRSAKADEEMKGRQLEESSAQRALTQRSLDQSREATQAGQLRDDVRATNAMRPKGRVISPEQYDTEVKSGGISPDFFLRKAVPDEEAVDSGVPESLAQNDPNKAAGFEFQGTAAEMKTPSTGTTNTKSFKLNGKDIVAQETPQGRVMFQGKDITDEPGLSPYVAPDRALVQSGEGYIPRPEAAARLRAGGDVPLATTSSTRTMQEGATMLEPHVKSVAAQATELDKAGLFGPVMSRVRNILAKAGTIDEFVDNVSSDPELSNDRRVGKFITTLGLLASGAGRVHGGARGGGSTQMLAYFKNMLSDASTLDMFLGRIDGVDEYMTGYAEGPGGSKPAAGGGDAYQEYLKRTQGK